MPNLLLKSSLKIENPNTEEVAAMIFVAGNEIPTINTIRINGEPAKGYLRNTRPNHPRQKFDVGRDGVRELKESNPLDARIPTKLAERTRISC